VHLLQQCQSIAHLSFRVNPITVVYPERNSRVRAQRGEEDATAKLCLSSEAVGDRFAPRAKRTQVNSNSFTLLDDRKANGDPINGR
jgi:hypothetical protein